MSLLQPNHSLQYISSRMIELSYNIPRGGRKDKYSGKFLHGLNELWVLEEEKVRCLFD
jgi:hypothetical protein